MFVNSMGLTTDGRRPTPKRVPARERPLFYGIGK